MNPTDEPEEPRGPLPPHERTWRHPAELGEWSRTRMQSIAAPPPLSRRLTAIVAVTSVALSIAVVTISVPRLDDDQPVDDVVGLGAIRGTQTTDAVPTGDAAAAAMIGGYLMSSLEEIGTRSTVTLNLDDGRVVDDATVILVDELIGLVFLEDSTTPRKSSSGSSDPDGSSDVSLDPTLGAMFDATFDVTSLRSGDIVMVGARGGDSPTSARIGVGTSRADGVLPLEISADVTGVRRVYGDGGRLVGIAIRHHHGTWLVTQERISRLLGGARAATR